MLPDDRAAHPLDPARIIVTLEVFDTATGRTSYTMPFAEVAGVDPQPFSPVGATPAEPAQEPPND